MVDCLCASCESLPAQHSCISRPPLEVGSVIMSLHVLVSHVACVLRSVGDIIIGRRGGSDIIIMDTACNSICQWTTIEDELLDESSLLTAGGRRKEWSGASAAESLRKDGGRK